jgi:flagellar motor switch protein FliN/FliY
MVSNLLGGVSEVVEVDAVAQPQPQPEAFVPRVEYQPPAQQPQQFVMPEPVPPAPQQTWHQPPENTGFQQPGGVKKGQVEVQPAQFTTLAPPSAYQEPRNIDLILDVPLDMTVELGKTKKSIRDILELGPGSIIQLDKLAGEPVDLLVNGKLIAKGEVVVIDESYGIRITAIVSPMDRMSKLQ